MAGRRLLQPRRWSPCSHPSPSELHSDPAIHCEEELHAPALGCGIDPAGGNAVGKLMLPFIQKAKFRDVCILLSKHGSLKTNLDGLPLSAGILTKATRRCAPVDLPESRRPEWELLILQIAWFCHVLISMKYCKHVLFKRLANENWIKICAIDLGYIR